MWQRLIVLLTKIRTDPTQKRSHSRHLAIVRALEHPVSSLEEGWLERLDSIRWLHRVIYHLWRIERHLQLAEEVGKEAPVQSDTRKLELDMEED